jgi:hypothetical protein
VPAGWFSGTLVGASFTSVGGRVLEGNGVTPDVEVEPGAVIDAAAAWIARP